MLYGGIAFFVVPQLLAGQHVPAETIAGITAAAFSANFWSVIFGPILDVRFSRRWYAAVLAALTSLLVLIAVMNLDRLMILEVALVGGTASAMLSSTALGGWVSTVTLPGEKHGISAWANIGYIGGLGITSTLGGELVRHLPPWLAASLLSGLVLLPAALFALIPARGPDQRLARESFRQFNRNVLALLRRREILIALALFLSPCASFALSNMLGGFGNDFHASPRMISVLGGAGTIFAGILGCLLFPLVAKRLPLRMLYLANGILGALFTLSLLLLPHSSWTFALAMMGEVLFLAVSSSTACGIIFETIGQDNPLAATAFTFLLTCANIPTTYMLLIDGKGYTRGGIAGSFIADAGIGIAACLLMGLLLTRLRGNAFDAGIIAIELPPGALPQED
jgi:PAT family beta-lactamase induction signal transducer AmpG